MSIPLYRPYFGDEEIEAVSRVLRSKKLSRGKETDFFEREFAEFTKKKYAIAVNSGTSGLHVAVRALGWKSGDEVITTPFSYVASSNVLLFENITPVFVDIDPQTLNIDLNKIEKAITSRTKGILPVHILGLPVQAEPLRRIKEKYGLQIIEDACEAIGMPSEDFTVSNVGDATVYGFHENKQMTTGGEGGMIVTDDIDIAKKCWSIRDQGRSSKKDWINEVVLGYNFRMTEMQAAFGREQLKRMEAVLAKRELLANKYAECLSGVEGLYIPQDMKRFKRSWFLYFVIFEDKKTRDRMQKILADYGITTSNNYFPTIYDFPMYKKFKNDCRISEKVSDTLLALPMFYEMNEIDVQRVAEAIKGNLLKEI